ncbi:AAA family ATPase [Brevundimonas sp.]|uniref:AAA family ATPase n=1 Tax=Brevundimonas sp. TaxID=1871086 RepID=UPI0017BEDE6B|nr:AAA family ATPase [Brevundimonas sp.]MBA4807064.1 AAA family ATPase [Brevundimonas sp.]
MGSALANKGDTRTDPLGGGEVFTGEQWVPSRSPAGQAVELAANDPALPFIDLASWVGREPADRYFLVPGLIPGGCVTSLYGDGGSGKTLLALWLMVCMASKHSAKWLDTTVLGWKSVGLFAEDDTDEIVRRLIRICDGAGVEFEKVAPLITALPGVGMDTIVAYFADTGDLVITPLMESLLAKVREVGANLLVLDYAAAIFGGNEIDRYQVSAFMRRLNAIAKEHDISILLLGHPSVDGMKGGRGTSGSTAWRNQSRAFLHLTVNEEQSDPDERRLLTLTLTKSNYSRVGLTFHLASDGGRFEILEAPAARERAKGPRLSASQKVALKALNQAVSEGGERSPGGPIPNGAQVVKVTLWREYAYRMEISDASPEARKKSFARAVKELVAKGIVGVAEPLCWIIEEGDK